MAEIYFENLNEHRPDITMKNVYFGLKDFEYYLTTGLRYLEQTRFIVKWKLRGFLIKLTDNINDLKEGKIKVYSLIDSEDELELDVIEVYRKDNLLLLNEKPQGKKIKIESDIKRKILGFKVFPLKKMREAIELTERVWVELSEDKKTFGTVKEFLDSASYDTGRNTLLNSVDFDTEQENKEEQELVVVDHKVDEEMICLDKVPAFAYLACKPNTYVIKKQRNAIRNLKDRPHSAHKPLIKLFEQANHVDWPYFDKEEVSNWYFLTDPTRPGTDEQREFVEKALATPDFFILEGPPGSGKTTAILELIIQLHIRGKNIILSGSTHIAVDNVIERIKGNKNDKNRIFLVRIGNESDVSELAAAYCLTQMTKTELNEWVKDLENVKNKKKEQRELLEILKSKSGKEQVKRLILENADLTCGTTIGILQHPVIKGDNGSLPQFDYLILDEASKTTFSEFLVPGLLAKRWIIVGDRKQLAPYVEGTWLKENVKAAVFTKSSQTEQNELNEEEVGLITADIYHGTCFINDVLIVCSDNRAIRQGYYKQAEYIFKRLEGANWNSEDDKIVFLENLIEMEYIEKAIILAGAKIIIGSEKEITENKNILPLYAYLTRLPQSLDDLNRTAKAYKRDKKVYSPKSLEGEIAWRMGREYEIRLLPELFEDEDEENFYRRQINNLMPAEELTGNTYLESNLRALTRVAMPSILESLQCGFGKKNYKDNNAICDGFPGYALANRVVRLTFQHRMHPEISRFPRKYIYKEEALKDPDYIEGKRAWDYNRYKNRMIWLDVKGQMDRKNNQNELEAAAIQEHLQNFGEWSKNNRPSEGYPWTVAVLTFYNGQRDLLMNKVQRWRGSVAKRYFNFSQHGECYLKIDLCSVDSFQGHEADLVFLSPVRTSGTGFLDNPNRLNVALTRARYQMIVVGSHSFWKEKKHNARLLRKLAEEVEQMGQIERYLDYVKGRK